MPQLGRDGGLPLSVAQVFIYFKQHPPSMPDIALRPRALISALYKLKTKVQDDRKVAGPQPGGRPGR